jgi:hypothetical protein
MSCELRVIKIGGVGPGHIDSPYPTQLCLRVTIYCDRNLGRGEVPSPFLSFPQFFGGPLAQMRNPEGVFSLSSRGALWATWRSESILNGGVTSPYVTLYFTVRYGDLTAQQRVIHSDCHGFCLRQNPRNETQYCLRVMACPDRIAYKNPSVGTAYHAVHRFANAHRLFFCHSRESGLLAQMRNPEGSRILDPRFREGDKQFRKAA